MMDIKELKMHGVDYVEGLKRFADNKELYENYLKSFFTNGKMDMLISAIDMRNYAAAFRVAHDLKGISGNLSLTFLFSEICNLVELLRIEPVDKEEQINRQLKTVVSIYNDTKEVIG